MIRPEGLSLRYNNTYRIATANDQLHHGPTDNHLTEELVPPPFPLPGFHMGGRGMKAEMYSM